MKYVSLIIPTYNEAANIRMLIPAIFKAIEGHAIDMECIVVDDNSPDGTAEAADELSARYAVRVVKRAGKLGLGSAVIAGCALSKRDILGVIDADLSHDPALIPELVRKLDEADIAIGSRFVKGGLVEHWRIDRKLTSYAGVFLARLLTGAADPLTGYFFLKRRVIDGVPLNTQGYKILFEILCKGKHKNVAELPIIFRERAHGESKLNAREYWLFGKQLARYGFAKYKQGFAAAALLAVFAGAVAGISASQSLWLDEGINKDFTERTPAEIIHLSKTTDLQQPLYTLILRAGSAITGTSAPAYRAWSLLCALITLAVLHRRFRSPWLLAAFATSPFLVYYASELRVYAAVIAVSLLHILLFEKIVRGSAGRALIAAYALLTILGAYLFYLFLFLPVGELAYALLFARGALKRLIGPWIASAAAYSPWLYAVIPARMGESPGHFLDIPWWQIPAIVFGGFAGGRVAITDMRHIHDYWPTIMVIVANLHLIANGLRHIKENDDKERMRLITTVGGVFMGICLIISYGAFSIFDPRYYAPIFPLYLLLLGICMKAAASPAHRAIPGYSLSCALLIVANIAIISLYAFNPAYGRENWKGVVPQLEAELREKDAIVFIGYNQPPPTYTPYQTKQADIISAYPEKTPPEDIAAIEAHLSRELADNDRVWYSRFLEWQKDPHGAIRRIIERDFTRIKTIGAFKVQFDLYARR